KRAARPYSDGPEFAGPRRLGRHAPDQGRDRDEGYSRHCTHGARHVRRSRKGAVGRLRRFRHQADRHAASSRQDQSPRRSDRVVNADGAALLVVDDNEDNRYTLSRRLTREGYTNLTMATNGREALDQLQEK